MSSRIETWISRRSDASAAALHRLSRALVDVNRPILVHDADCPIRRIAARSDRNQHSPPAYRFPVPANMFLRQTSDFQDVGLRPGVPSKSERLTSLTSSRENPDFRRSVTTLSAVVASLNKPIAVFAIILYLSACISWSASSSTVHEAKSK